MLETFLAAQIPTIRMDDYSHGRRLVQEFNIFTAANSQTDNGVAVWRQHESYDNIDGPTRLQRLTRYMVWPHNGDDVLNFPVLAPMILDTLPDYSLHQRDRITGYAALLALLYKERISPFQVTNGLIPASRFDRAYPKPFESPDGAAQLSIFYDWDEPADKPPAYIGVSEVASGEQYPIHEFTAGLGFAHSADIRPALQSQSWEGLLAPSRTTVAGPLDKLVAMGMTAVLASMTLEMHSWSAEQNLS